MLGRKKTPLKKDLRLLDVYAIATGTTLSAGFFLLPGLAASQAGMAIVAAYLIAAIPLIPAMFSIIELSTAMPRAGGMYYFLDRTLGPLFGTIGGFGTWLALILKVAFALVGMGAYITLFMPDFPIRGVGVVIAVLLGLLNFFGTKKTGSFQVFLVFGLLAFLAVFIGAGIPEIKPSEVKFFFTGEIESILSTAGLVYISYVGVTNVASLSEEVDNPERNLPKGIILALSSAIIVYGLGTSVMAGVLPLKELQGSLTPVADAAKYFLGDFGVILLSAAALLAFISVANAGTMSASRYPLAMSRDHLLPQFLKRLSKFDTPIFGIVVTVLSIVAILIFLDPTNIAKLASTFQLLMFAFICLAVIVMRESKIQSYDPGYYSPFYPYMQILGIVAPLFLIVEMGWLPMLFTIGLITVGAVWFFYYARRRVYRSGAVYHIFQRLGQRRYDQLDSELRGILKEKGLRKGDPFDETVMRGFVLEYKKETTFEKVVDDAAAILENVVPLEAYNIKAQIFEGSRLGATPVTHGVALPHIRVKGLNRTEMVIVRGLKGIHIKSYNPLTHKEEGESDVFAIFFLISPEENPAQHLRFLAQIAGRVDDDGFKDEWDNVKDCQQLKEVLLRDERFLSLYVDRSAKTAVLIGRPLRSVDIPDGTLVALIRRGEETIIPKGNTIFRHGDRLTIIGEPDSIKELQKKFVYKH